MDYRIYFAITTRSRKKTALSGDLIGGRLRSQSLLPMRQTRLCHPSTDGGSVQQPLLGAEVEGKSQLDCGHPSRTLMESFVNREVRISDQI